MAPNQARRVGRSAGQALSALFVLLLCLPAVHLGALYAAGQLGAMPLERLIEETGSWALRLLAATLAISPARQLMGRPAIMRLRQPLGLAAACYAGLHLVLYATDQGLDLVKVISEIVLRFYLTIGFVALLGLAVLASTSPASAKRRLGGLHWRRLHRTIYVIALLALLHAFLQAGREAFEVTVVATILAWLLAWRCLPSARRSYPAALSLLLASASLVALIEAAVFHFRLGAPFLAVLWANISFQAGLRPVILMLALMLGLLAALWLARARRTTPR